MMLIAECSNGLKSPERKDCCPAFFFFSTVKPVLSGRHLGMAY